MSLARWATLPFAHGNYGPIGGDCYEGNQDIELIV